MKVCHYHPDLYRKKEVVIIDKSKIKRDNARVEKWRNMMPKLETMIEKRDIKRKNLHLAFFLTN